MDKDFSCCVQIRFIISIIFSSRFTVTRHLTGSGAGESCHQEPDSISRAVGLIGAPEGASRTI